MLNVAFKEWAVVCQALAEGRQSLILRKGGIAEENGLFRPDHDRFWLYPTYLHQQAAGVKPEAAALLERVEREKPPAGIVRIQHYLEVSNVRFLDTLDEALALAPLHIWSDETVRMRFHYRKPGLYALDVKVVALPVAYEVVETPEYEGCKTWVMLNPPLATVDH